MDNITHTLAGVVLARTGLGRTSRLATAAVIVGANLPDADLLWSVGDEIRYLHFHRGWTHSFFGTVVCSILLWAALLALSYVLPARPGPAALRPYPLLGMAVLGVGSHFLMDSANAYGVRPFLPWDDRWVYGDLWVIIDPWVWLLLGGAVFLSRRGGPLRSALWILAAAGVTAVMLATPSVPRAACWVWILGACGVVIVRLRGAGAGRTLSLCRACLALLALYAAACAAAAGLARVRLGRLVEAELSVPREASRALLPRPADPLRWDGIVEEEAAIHHRTIGIVAGLDPPHVSFERFERQHADPRVAAVLESCPGRTLLGFVRFPVAVVETRAGGKPLVVLRDARYARGRRSGFGVFSVPLAEDGSPELDGLACLRAGS